MEDFYNLPSLDSPFWQKCPEISFQKLLLPHFNHAMCVELGPPLLQGWSFHPRLWAHKTTRAKKMFASLVFSNSYKDLSLNRMGWHCEVWTAATLLQMWGGEPSPVKGLPCEMKPTLGKAEQRNWGKHRALWTSFKPLVQAGPEPSSNCIFNSLNQIIPYFRLNWFEWQHSHPPNSRS